MKDLSITSEVKFQKVLQDLKNFEFKLEYGFELLGSFSSSNVYRTHNKKYIIKVDSQSKQIHLNVVNDLFLEKERTFKTDITQYLESFLKEKTFFNSQTQHTLAEENDVMEFLERLEFIDKDKRVIMEYVIS